MPVSPRSNFDPSQRGYNFHNIDLSGSLSLEKLNLTTAMKVMPHAIWIVALTVFMPPVASHSQQVIVGGGGLYSTPFAPTGGVLVNPPNGGLLNVVLGGTAGPSAVGNWDLSASGGASVSVLGLGLLEYGSSTSLTGTSLEFGSSSPSSTLLNLIGTGTSITSSWEATFVLDEAGKVVTLTPLTTYSVSFFVNGQNGLFDNTLNISPSFTFEFLDGSGTAIQEQSGSSSLNLLGLFGSGVPSGTANFTFTTGSSVSAGAVALRFSADADLNTVALGLGDSFAEISALAVTATPVPEPDSLVLMGVAGVCAMFSRRRKVRSCTRGGLVAM